MVHQLVHNVDEEHDSKSWSQNNTNSTMNDENLYTFKQSEVPYLNIIKIFSEREASYLPQWDVQIRRILDHGIQKYEPDT